MRARFDSIMSGLDDMVSAQTFGIVLLALALVSGATGYISQHPGGLDLGKLAADFYANVSTEMVSIAITVLIIDKLNERRERRVGERLEREQLTRQLGSTVNEVARRAVEELRDKGWLTDGSLQGTDLRAAHLEDARLWKADLQGANMQWAKLKKANLNGSTLVGTNLTQANLQTAKLGGADLRGANLFEAKLYRAVMHGADVRYATLDGAHLEGARLEGANLLGASLANVFIDEFTVLPDGQAWSPETDLARFTDAQHPQFWQPPVTRADAGSEQT